MKKKRLVDVFTCVYKRLRLHLRLLGLHHAVCPSQRQINRHGAIRREPTLGTLSTLDAFRVRIRQTRSCRNDTMRDRRSRTRRPRHRTRRARASTLSFLRSTLAAGGPPVTNVHRRPLRRIAVPTRFPCRPAAEVPRRRVHPMRTLCFRVTCLVWVDSCVQTCRRVERAPIHERGFVLT